MTNNTNNTNSNNQIQQVPIKVLLDRVKFERTNKEREKLKSLKQLPFKNKYLNNDPSVFIDLITADTDLNKLTGTEVYYIADIIKSLYAYIELRNKLMSEDEDLDFINKYSQEINTEIQKSLESIKLDILKLSSVQDFEDIETK